MRRGCALWLVALLLLAQAQGTASAGIPGLGRNTPEKQAARAAKREARSLRRAAKAEAREAAAELKAQKKIELLHEKRRGVLRLAPYRAADLPPAEPRPFVVEGAHLRGKAPTPAHHDTRELVRESLVLKEQFRGRAKVVQISLLGTRAPDGSEIDVRQFLANVEDALESHPMVAIDSRQWFDRRVVVPSATVRRNASLLLGRLARIPGAVPAEYSVPQVQTASGELLTLIGEHDFYANQGLDAVRDLLNDEVMAERLSARTAGALGGKRSHQTDVIMPLVKALGESADGLRLARLDPARPETHPLELQVAAEQDPAVRQALWWLGKRGVKLRLQRVTRTPDGLLQAINLVSVVSQESYLRNWLPDLISKGVRPNLRPTPKGLKRARSTRLIGKTEDPRARLEAAVDLIQAGVPEYLKVITEDGGEDLPELAIINRSLDGSRRSFARRRMIYDNAHDRTEGAQAVIKALLVIGPVAHGLEAMNQGGLAKVVTASADDVGAQVSEWLALRGASFTKGELARRAILLVPVFGAATAGAFKSHHLIEAGHGVVGGATFGASAVALSLTTALQSIHMYRQGYEELLRAGKIPGKIGPAMQKRFQQELNALELRLGKLLTPEHRPELIRLVSKHLDLAVAEGTMSEAEKAATLADLERVDMHALLRSVTVPSERSQWWQAVLQDFSNPARLGLFLGAFAAPIVGGLTGGAGLLNNGWVLAGVGSTESIVAAATVFAANKIDEARYRGRLSRDLATLRGADRWLSGFVQGKTIQVKAHFRAREREED